MSLSFVLPMYNEAEIIRESIQAVTSIATHLTDDYEIIVVDDGSTDESVSIVEELVKKDERLRVITLEKNSRFAGALKKGLESATKETIIYTDSDLGIDEEDIKKSLPLIEDADIVNIYSKKQKGETLGRMIISIIYNLLVNFLFRLHIRDVNSSFKIFRRDVVQGMELISTSPFIDAEIFIRAKASGYRIAQTPIVFEDRTGGRSSMARPSIIFAIFRDILKFRFFGDYLKNVR